MSQCIKCGLDAKVKVGINLFCYQHHREYLRNRWDPRIGGADALKRFAFECFPEYTKPQFGYCSFHGKIDEFFAKGLNCKTNNFDARFATFGFRGSAKTTKSTINAVCATAFDLKGYIVYRSDKEDKAKANFLEPFKRMIQSQRFRYVFGELRPGRFELKEYGLKFIEGIVILNNKLQTKIMPLGLNQSSRGLIHKGIRPDLFFWDDVEFTDNTKTDTAIQYILDKVEGEDLPALDLERGMFIGLQTPIVREGVYQWMLGNASFQTVEKPLYKRDQIGEWLVDEDGKRIPEWPEKFHSDVCKKIEQTTTRKKFNREYLLQLSSEEDRRIPESKIQFATIQYQYEMGNNWIKIIESNGMLMSNPQWELADITISADPATSEKGDACNSAITVLATLFGGRKFVIDSIAGKMRARDFLKNPAGHGMYDIETNYANIEKKGIIGEIFRLALFYHPTRVVLETKGEYENSMRELSYSYDYWYSRRTKHRFDLCPYPDPTGEKIDRIIDTLETEFNTGRIYLCGEYKIIKNDDGRILSKQIPHKALFDELIGLDEGGKVDRADSLHMAVRFSQEPKSMTQSEVRSFKLQKFNQPDPIVQMHGFI